MRDDYICFQCRYYERGTCKLLDKKVSPYLFACGLFKPHYELGGNKR